MFGVRTEKPMRVACITMQKDEDYLLGPWLAYHGHLFGFHNLYVLDNGSISRKVTGVLEDYQRRGVNVCRSFPTKHDFYRKGDIIGQAIKQLDATGAFDFLYPTDCDEFLSLRTSWGYTCQPECILSYLASLRGEKRTLRIPYQIANNPYEDDFYTYFSFYKTFFARGTFESIDRGFHQGKTKGNPGCRDVDLAHIHFHHPPFSMLVERSRRKWSSPLKPEEARGNPSYDGKGVHLIPYFSMTERDYWARCMGNVQFYVPGFLDLLRYLGEPLVMPREPPGVNLLLRHSFREAADKLITASDRMDLGPLTRTAMFVPQSGSEQWTKIYFQEQDYLRKHPDVCAARSMTAMHHFCHHGYREANRMRSLLTSGAAFPSISGNAAVASVLGLLFALEPPDRFLTGM